MSALSKSLATIFAAAAIGLGTGVYLSQNEPDALPGFPAAVSLAPEGNYVVTGAYASRGLTPGEKELAQKLFGDRVDTSRVQLNFLETGPRNLISDVAIGDGRNILIYGRKNASDDYSRETAGNFGTFVYELTQIWQNQHKGRYTQGQRSWTGYPLSSRWNFTDYGPVQQSQIMEDYARRFLHPDHATAWLPNKYGSDRSDTDPFLRALVEDQFPAAREAREALKATQLRGLTAPETALLKGIFGGQLDTGPIRLNQDPRKFSDIVGSVSTGETADFWGSKNHSRDYTQEKDGELFGTFVHELTHNWQKQNGYRYTNWQFVNKPDKYVYPLDAKFKFTDYGTEQQAAMIEDYARRFLHPSKSFTYLGKSYFNPEGKAGLLAWMVESQFPQAKALRLQYEQTGSFTAGVPVSSYRPAAAPKYALG